EGYIVPFKILVHHRHYTNWEIASYASTYLEKSHTFTSGIIAVPICQPNHVFDTALHGAGFQLIFNNVRSEDVTHRAILPSRHYDRDIFLGGRYHPAILWVNLVVLFQHTTQ